MVSPAWSVLPMGCSWSLYFPHSVTETIASRAASLQGLSPLHDKTRDLFLGRREGVHAYYVYVDNLGVSANLEYESLFHGQQPLKPIVRSWTMINGKSRRLMRKRISISVPPSKRSLFEELERCRWNVSGYGCWNRCEDIIILETKMSSARSW